MSQSNQRQGVHAAIIAVLGKDHGKIDWDGLEKSKKEAIFAHLQKAFMAQEISFKGELTAETVRKYIPGLVNNWVRKDPNLNGGGKYVPKNPGSRQGSGDDQLSALKGLRGTLTDAKAIAEVDAAIEKRKAEIKPAPKVIKVEALPPHLRHLVPASANTQGEPASATG